MNFSINFIYDLVEANICKQISPKEGKELLKKLSGNISRQTANYLLDTVCFEHAEHYVNQFCKDMYSKELIAEFKDYFLGLMLKEVE
jgi:predicted DNA-binding protein